MLGLPASTEVRRIITKKKIFERFGAEMNAERRKRFDSEIARLTVVNEVSPVSVNLLDGETIHGFFVLLVQLRKQDCDTQNTGFLARLFGQKLLMVLEAGGRQRLAAWQTRLLMSDWAQPDTLSIELTGLTLDQAWAHIVSDIAGIQLEEDHTLDEQIAIATQREKLEKELSQLEKLTWAERQPKRKMELVKHICVLREQLGGNKDA